MSLFDTIDFRGKTVLDIGCWDGLWSFEAERRGAAAVYATDDTSQRPFGQSSSLEVARGILDSKVIYRPDVSVYDVDQLQCREFDIVLFLGVYYHLKHPLYALSKLRRVCKENALLLIEGPAFRSRTRSFARFYYGRWHLGDASNWWIPSRKCLREMVECSFFQVTDELRATKFRRTKWREMAFASLETTARVLLNPLYPHRYILKARAVSRADPNYVFPDADLCAFDEVDYGNKHRVIDRRGDTLRVDRLAFWVRSHNR